MRVLISVLILFCILVFMVLMIITADANEQQRRFYRPNGSSAGTATPYDRGSWRYYDEHGRTIGTSTTTNGVTTYYDDRGSVIGRSR